MQENSYLFIPLVSFIPIIFYALCLYFTLSFFQQLKDGDSKRIKQTKLFAVLSLIIALATPTVVSFITMRQMMNF
ncbi:MAG: hypothetical protein ABS944_10965 [Solibacillus sp.]|uniref:hypothetical protein n=1 Tax=unclassified Solibacillus TaxID=2637870 RepID=UPI0030F69901